MSCPILLSVFHARIDGNSWRCTPCRHPDMVALAGVTSAGAPCGRMIATWCRARVMPTLSRRRAAAGACVFGTPSREGTFDSASCIVCRRIGTVVVFCGGRKWLRRIVRLLGGLGMLSGRHTRESGEPHEVFLRRRVALRHHSRPPR